MLRWYRRIRRCEIRICAGVRDDVPHPHEWNTPREYSRSAADLRASRACRVPVESETRGKNRLCIGKFALIDDLRHSVFVQRGQRAREGIVHRFGEVHREISAHTEGELEAVSGQQLILPVERELSNVDVLALERSAANHAAEVLLVGSRCRREELFDRSVRASRWNEP